MKIRYDIESDTMTIHLRRGRVHESGEAAPGVVLDYDAGGNVLEIEVLDASRRVDDPRNIEFAQG